MMPSMASTTVPPSAFTTTYRNLAVFSDVNDNLRTTGGRVAFRIALVPSAVTIMMRTFVAAPRTVLMITAATAAFGILTVPSVCLGCTIGARRRPDYLPGGRGF